VQRVTLYESGLRLRIAWWGALGDTVLSLTRRGRYSLLTEVAHECYWQQIKAGADLQDWQDELASYRSET
jgi:hypothetical protein